MVEALASPFGGGMEEALPSPSGEMERGPIKRARPHGLAQSIKTYIIIHVGLNTQSNAHHMALRATRMLLSSRILCLRPLHRERQTFMA